MGDDSEETRVQQKVKLVQLVSEKTPRVHSESRSTCLSEQMFSMMKINKSPRKSDWAEKKKPSLQCEWPQPGA